VKPEPADMPARDGSDRSERFVLQFVRAEPALHAYILSLLPNWADAEEVLQQTGLILWRKFDEFEAGTNFLGWACKIARFEALNFRKKHRRDRHVFSDELVGLLADEALDEAHRQNQERRALARCLAKLKKKHRELIRRCYSRGASIKQVAAEMGKSANAVYKMLDRTRLTLMDCIRHTLSTEDL